MTTEIVKASELQEKVVRRIFELRHPEVMGAYRKALATFKRRTKGKQKIQVLRNTLLGKTKDEGYFVKVFDELVEIKEPKRPNPIAWRRSGYDRSFGSTFHAEDSGLLANGGLYNRELRKERVDEYVEEMVAGRWHDPLSDPIAVTADGQVVNGQHRIAAVTRVNWSEDEGTERDPSFLVIWGVDPQEALHADGGRRTARDEKTIATKILAMSRDS